MPLFRSAAESATIEQERRRAGQGDVLRFGIEYLDDALRGIFPDDLVLVGAPSGVGKTQLCCNLALANLEDGRRVHYIALEASEFEIERRLKYPLVAERFFSDPNRPRLNAKLNYPDWLAGKFFPALDEYEKSASDYFAAAYTGLNLLYKGDKFGSSELVESVLYCAEDTDLIIIDHVHYFDFDDDNENRALREIAKTVRSLAIDHKKPIVLVAHLRKRDRMNEELCAGLDEFHGSSDLTKIATKVVTVAPGKPTQDGLFETFFRVPKNRSDQSPTKFLAREFFSPRKGGYENGKYQLGWAEQKRSKGFEALDRSFWPEWAKRGGGRGDPDSRVQRIPPTSASAWSKRNFGLGDKDD